MLGRPHGAFCHSCHVSRVPFRWETLVGTFDMAFLGGVLGIDAQDRWISPRLGHAVVELLPASERRDGHLPEPWTLAEVQRVTGCPEARLMPAVGTVTLHGEPVRTDVGIDLDGICVVRAGTGHWYSVMGSPTAGT